MSTNYTLNKEKTSRMLERAHELKLSFPEMAVLGMLIDQVGSGDIDAEEMGRFIPYEVSSIRKIFNKLTRLHFLRKVEKK